MGRSIPVPLLPSRLRWAIVAVVGGFIFYKSILTTPSRIPSTGLTPLDKWLHFLVYAALGAVLAYALVERDITRRRRILLVLLVTGSYGMGMEVGQAVLPARYFGFDDLGANTVGALSSLLWFAAEPRLTFVQIPQSST